MVSYKSGQIYKSNKDTLPIQGVFPIVFSQYRKENLKMLIDKKSQVSTILMKLPKIFSNTEFKIFDVVVFLLALVCKKNKMC